jgi:hypothetical protein
MIDSGAASILPAGKVFCPVVRLAFLRSSAIFALQSALAFVTVLKAMAQRLLTLTYEKQYALWSRESSTI